MLKSLLVGLAIALGFYGLWIVNMTVAPPDFFVTNILMISPAFAAFATAWLAPRHKIWLGTSMAILACFLRGAFLLYLFSQKYAGVPGGEAWGFKESLIATVQWLAINTVLCSVGATAALVLKRDISLSP